MRILRNIAAAVATVAFAAIPAAAEAQPLSSVAIATGASSWYLVLDVRGGSLEPGAAVVQWYGHGGANQRWNFVELGDGTQQIVNQKSSMCLTTSGKPGAPLFQWPCTGAPGQRWKGDLPRAAYSGMPLKNPASGLVLDVYGGWRSAGTPLTAWYPNGGMNQTFSYYQLGW
jgi:Ricin-type beta-trefoil lectin domain